MEALGEYADQATIEDMDTMGGPAVVMENVVMPAEPEAVAC